MTRRMLALGGAALALLMVSSVSDPADAHRRSGGHGWGGGGHHHGHMHRFHHRFHHHHHFRHRHVFIGAPFVYGAYNYGDGCYWLKRRALYTGSPYWWSRYYACVDGYGY